MPRGAVVAWISNVLFPVQRVIPRLADRYRVIAPDLPRSGFTEVPENRKYVYTFDILARTIEQFTDALGLLDVGWGGAVRPQLLPLTIAQN
jgi:pimeloyl-ACP methyl ester carboxylesterase